MRAMCFAQSGQCIGIKIMRGVTFRVLVASIFVAATVDALASVSWNWVNGGNAINVAGNLGTLNVEVRAQTRSIFIIAVGVGFLVFARVARIRLFVALVLCSSTFSVVSAVFSVVFSLFYSAKLTQSLPHILNTHRAAARSPIR